MREEDNVGTYYCPMDTAKARWWHFATESNIAIGDRLVNSHQTLGNVSRVRYDKTDFGDVSSVPMRVASMRWITTYGKTDNDWRLMLARAGTAMEERRVAAMLMLKRKGIVRDIRRLILDELYECPRRQDWNQWHDNVKITVSE